MKTYDITFVALQPVENSGQFRHDGTEEEAKTKLIAELTQAFGESGFKLLSFVESAQLPLPTIDGHTIH